MSERVTRAFDRPLTASLPFPEQLNLIGFKDVAKQALDLTSTNPNGSLAANPGYASEYQRQAYGAIVKIETDAGHGTGFITRDSTDRQVVITAAHVVSEQDCRSLRIIDMSGATTNATDGRYILEKNGDFYLPRINDSPDLDIAALRLSDPIGNKGLEIGQLAARGAWVDMINYQSDDHQQGPHHYKALVVTERPGRGNIGVTGLEPERKAEPSSHYAVQQGASGGPLIDMQTGKVAGVAHFGGTVMLRSGDLRWMKIIMSEPFGDVSGLYPLPVQYTDPTYIPKVISSLPE